MQETMDSLDALTNHVNECNQEAENEQQVLAVENSVTGLEFVCISSIIIEVEVSNDLTIQNLAVPGRSVLRDGNVWVSTEKEKLKARRLVVFNDMLLIAKAKNKKYHQCVIAIDSNSMLYAATPSTPLTNSQDSTQLPRSPGGRHLMRKRSSRGGSLVSEHSY